MSILLSSITNSSNPSTRSSLTVYGLLLYCKHIVQSRQGTTAYVYPVSLMMPLYRHRTLMGYSHVGSQSLTRALWLCGRQGFFRRRFNLFAIKQFTLQSWWSFSLVSHF